MEHACLALPAFAVVLGEIPRCHAPIIYAVLRQPRNISDIFIYRAGFYHIPKRFICCDFIVVFIRRRRILPRKCECGRIRVIFLQRILQPNRFIGHGKFSDKSDGGHIEAFIKHSRANSLCRFCRCGHTPVIFRCIHKNRITRCGHISRFLSVVFVSRCNIECFAIIKKQVADQFFVFGNVFAVRCNVRHDFIHLRIFCQPRGLVVF